MTLNGTDETKILENRRACARHEISVIVPALNLIPGIRKDEIKRRVEEHLARAEGGLFAGALSPEEIASEITRAHRLKPKTVTVNTSQSGPVEVVGKVKTQTAAVLPLRGFLQVERPELEWHIVGLLPRQGKMVLSGASKSGKTFLGLELALSLAAGQDLAGFRIPKPVRTLYLQPELSDSLLAARLKWILETADPAFDSEAALDNFLVFQCDSGRPNISRPEGQERIRRVIEEFKPDVIFADPLYMLCPGLVENAAEEMTLALDHIASWTTSGASIVLFHHFNKQNTARGSSVLSGWPESDMSMTLTDDRQHVKIEGVFRCIYGDEFPMYLERPSPDCAWFRAVPEGWEPAGRDSPEPKGKVYSEILSSTLRDAGRGMGYSELRRSLEQHGLSESAAKRAIGAAKSSGAIQHVAGVYYV